MYRISAADARFHEPTLNEARWLETNWFAFLIPEAGIRGHVYTGFRTSLGVAFSQVMIYSHSGDSLLDFDYMDSRVHLPIGWQGLERFELANGLKVRVHEPHKNITLTYADDREEVAFELTMDSLMWPVHISETAIPDTGAGFSAFHRVLESSDGRPLTGHLDQTMRVQGHLRMGQHDYDIDFPSNRDHSWGPRNEFGNSCGNFDEGHFASGLSFSVQTRNDDLKNGVVTHGFIRQGDRVVFLKGGVGRYEVDRWKIRSIVYELEDQDGRTYTITGTPGATAQAQSGSNQYAVMGQTRWTLDGETGHGEFLWHWDVRRMQRMIREGRL